MAGHLDDFLENQVGMLRELSTAIMVGIIVALAIVGSVVLGGVLQGQIVENKRMLEDLVHRFEVFEAGDREWKKAEGVYDQEVRNNFRGSEQNYNDALRQMNNRINEVALRVNGKECPQ